MLLRAEEHRRNVERYRNAYREHPETDAELAQAEGLAKLSFKGARWEE